jgi:hypothetical protein
MNYECDIKKRRIRRSMRQNYIPMDGYKNSEQIISVDQRVQKPHKTQLSINKKTCLQPLDSLLLNLKIGEFSYMNDFMRHGVHTV